MGGSASLVAGVPVGFAVRVAATQASRWRAGRQFTPERQLLTVAGVDLVALASDPVLVVEIEIEDGSFRRIDADEALGLKLLGAAYQHEAQHITSGAVPVPFAITEASGHQVAPTALDAVRAASGGRKRPKKG